METKSSSGLKLVFAVLVILGLAAGASAFYFYRQVQALKANPSQIAEEEIDELVFRVGALMVLPEGERPTVATVADPEALKDQIFFANAKAGSKVLIYPNARKAILYDPAGNKIIEVAPLTIGEGEVSSPPNR